MLTYGVETQAQRAVMKYAITEVAAKTDRPTELPFTHFPCPVP